MSSLRAALNTKMAIDDWIEEPRNIKQRTADDGEWANSKVIPAPMRCIQARNGIVEMQEAHRRSCSNEQCIAAFQIHGLLNHQSGTRDRRAQRSQPDEAANEEVKDELSTKKTKLELQSVLEYADATFPSGSVASVNITETMQSNGLNIHATEFVPCKGEAVHFVKLHHAVDSSGTADPTESPSLVGAVLRVVRGGVSQTDEREIADRR